MSRLPVRTADYLEGAQAKILGALRILLEAHGAKVGKVYLTDELGRGELQALDTAAPLTLAVGDPEVLDGKTVMKLNLLGVDPRILNLGDLSKENWLIELDAEAFAFFGASATSSPPGFRMRINPRMY